jgi:sec-independent protein translocase protein TatA
VVNGLFERWWLILIVLVVVLIIWGPGKLPDVGAGLGRAIREFRKASTETRDTIVNATSAPVTPSEPATPAPAAAPAPAPTTENPAKAQGEAAAEESKVSS